MPVPGRRDLDATRSALTGWLSERLPRTAHPRISAITVPDSSGFSNETLLVDAEWGRAGKRAGYPLAVRVAPTHFQMFPRTPFAEQYHLIRALDEGSGVPVPKVRWYEPDVRVLGAPFMVMDRARGRAPNDNPPYHEAGWVTEVSEEERSAMWWSGVQTLAEIHAAGVEGLGISFLAERGRGGLRRYLATWRDYQRWAYPGEQPVAEAAYQWLASNLPRQESEPVLLWGDARLGNILFDGGVRQAVLDWELATLGPPEIDLAWFVYLDRHHSEGCGNTRLDGFPGPDETVERYQRLTGHTVRDLPYFLVLSGYRFALIMARAVQLLMEAGLMPPVAANFAVDNSATKLLEKVLAEAGGG